MCVCVCVCIRVERGEILLPPVTHCQLTLIVLNRMKPRKQREKSNCDVIYKMKRPEYYVII